MPKPIRALFVTLHFGRLGGLEIYSLDVAKSLIRHGVDVNVVSVFTSETSHYEGVPMRGLMPRSSLLCRYYTRYWRHILELFLRGLRSRYDVVIAGHMFVLTQVAAFARRRRIPYWLCVYGIDAWADWSEPIRQAILGCHQIIAISSYTANSVRSRLNERGDRVKIVHPMVDMNLFVPRPSRKTGSPFCILTVGRLSASERYKGHELVISALPVVSKRLARPIEYWIVGDGDDRPRLEALVKPLGLSYPVKFFSRVPLEQLIDIYNACDVFVMPSRVEHRADGSWAGEGFGIVYLEAAACGKPVIAANQGGATDAVQDGVTGLLVNPTEDEVAEALCHLLADEQLRRRMGEAGRQFVVDNFSQAIFDQSWAKLIASLGLRG